MSKKLVLAIAISLVLVSGSLFSSAQAACFSLNPCNWHFPSLCGLHFPCFSCGSSNVTARDTDKPLNNNYEQNKTMDEGRY